MGSKYNLIIGILWLFTGAINGFVGYTYLTGIEGRMGLGITYLGLAAISGLLSIYNIRKWKKG